jgi:hypothetical protein
MLCCILRFVFIVSLLVFTIAPTVAASKAKGTSPITSEILSGGIVHNEGYYLPRGLKIPVELRTPLDTRTNAVGDEVTAQVTEDVLIGDYVIIPANSFIHGSVTLLEPPGKFQKRPKLGINFDTLSLPGKPGEERRYVSIDGYVSSNQVITKSERVNDDKLFKAQTKKPALLAGVVGAYTTYATLGTVGVLSKVAVLSSGLAGVYLATSMFTKDDIRVEAGTALQVLLGEPTVENFPKDHTLAYNTNRNVDVKLEEAGVLNQPLKKAGADISSGEAYDQLNSMQSQSIVNQ